MPTSTFKRVAVIMAGGVGERFWPVSRPEKPKQLLRLGNSGKTMLEDAVDRLAPLIRSENLYIATSRDLLPALEREHGAVPPQNIFGEPCRRNTAGCLAYAAAHLLAREPDPARVSIAVVTADHLIGEVDLFRTTVRVALEAAEQQEVLVTHGIVPTRPDTGYGYIQAADRDEPIHEADGVTVHGVVKFHEKPDAESAKTYLERGDFYWNAGMFFWRLDTFLSELTLAQPAMAEAVYAMAEAFRAGDGSKADAVFETLESLSIDYALMEKTTNVGLARAEYSWDDLGSWSSLERTREPDANGNIADGPAALIDCTNTLIYNATETNTPIAALGLDNLIVVNSPHGILVLPKDRAQDVRAAVEELKRRGLG